MRGIKCRRCERANFACDQEILLPKPKHGCELDGDYYPPIPNRCACCRRYVRGIV